jgi:hypothetical protein
VRKALVVMASSFPNIIYIMGPGRSGSTILEVLLINSPGIMGVGEITHVVRDGFMNDVVCSCGKRTSTCAFWSKVRASVNWDQKEVSSFVNLFRSVEWHSKFPLVAFGLVSEATIKKYNQVNRKLFEAAMAVSGESVIVDSSKYAGRGLALARSFPGKVKVICLTRCPAGLIYSFQKVDAGDQKPKSIIPTVIYYLYVMFCLRVVAWQLGSNVLAVQYDELIKDAVGTLGKIEKWSGIELAVTKQKLVQDALLDVGHIVTGNRMRTKGPVRFRPSQGCGRVESGRVQVAVFIMELYRRLLGL